MTRSENTFKGSRGDRLSVWKAASALSDTTQWERSCLPKALIDLGSSAKLREDVQELKLVEYHPTFLTHAGVSRANAEHNP